MSSVRSVPILAIDGTASAEKFDAIAVEEPLAIQIAYGRLQDRRRTTLSVTMRTPGHDADLAAGLLVSEGVVKKRDEILGIEVGSLQNTMRVELHPDVPLDLARLERQGYTSSACGVCGKTSLDAVESVCDGPAPGGRAIPAEVIHSLPARLLAAQPAFTETGGIHAAALFDMEGALLAVREDVGRHNAVDKLIGAEFLAGRLPLRDRVLFVSGRAGFELVQKAAISSAPVFAAVGAPTSLAVDLAQRLGVTLLGFVRTGRFNIYTGAERVIRAE